MTGSNPPQSVDSGFGEDTIEFANNGIPLGHFLIFSNAPIGNVPHAAGKQPAAMV
jgi:hypothetical protein